VSESDPDWVYKVAGIVLMVISAALSFALLWVVWYGV